MSSNVSVLEPISASASTTGSCPRGLVTDAEMATFADQGFLRLGRVVDDAALAGLQQRIDDIMLGVVQYPELMMQLDSTTGAYGDLGEQTAGFKGASLAYRKIEGLERDAKFLAYMQQPLIADICRRMVGPDISIFRSMFMNKPARQGTLLPWHQDGGTGWNLSIDPLITIWLALDPATVANGCVEVIPGSHKHGLLRPQGHVIGEELEQVHCRPGTSEFMELKPGEAVLLHNWLLHRSDRNATDQARRGFSVCLMDAATRKRDEPELRFPILFGKGAITATE